MTAAEPSQNRLISIDAYRGLVMFLLIAEQFGIGKVAEKVADPNSIWSFLHTQQSHVEWVGCVLHDLIQPSFSFLVGAALAFSVASRQSRGQSFGKMLWHAVVRSFVLIALGILLRSVGRAQTNFTFEDTLTQIGLGYLFLFLLAFRSPRFQWISFAVILAGYWLLFAMWPLPDAHFDWSHAGLKPDWHGNLTGFAAHWNKNTNPAWAFDNWFLNLFPRKEPFKFNGGGYATLSFIPTLATMLLGLLTGQWLRADHRAGRKLLVLVVGGLAALGAGWALGALGVCPVVKRIWTPSWVLFSGGWCLLILAFFHATTDTLNWRRWAFPLMVLGMNSIAAYVMVELWPGFLREFMMRHLPDFILNAFGQTYTPFLVGCFVVLSIWLVLFWMWRQKLFVRI
jgi:predicted acyltransferase